MKKFSEWLSDRRHEILLLKICAGTLLLLSFFLAGCSILWGNPGSYSEMSPEQIEAYRRSNIRVYQCLTAAGPPPIGRFVSILMPADMPPPTPILFGPDCQLR